MRPHSFIERGRKCFQRTGGGKGGVPRLYALRHFVASNLYARGVEIKVISKLLGHASTQIPYERYVRLFEGNLHDTLRQAVAGGEGKRRAA
jgi:site-specific recombinase XerD